MKEKIINWLREMAFRYCKRLLKKHTFAGEIAFETTFSSMAEIEKHFRIIENEFYNDNPVLFVKEALEILPGGGLKIKIIREKGMATTWQRSGSYTCKTGSLHSHGAETNKEWITQTGGTWIFEAIMPDTWAALWLLHVPYFVPEIGRNHIVPEIDIAEMNGRTVDNVLHYGYDKTKYSTKGRINHIHRPDGKLHQYAVELLADGYRYFIDGYLVTEFRSKEPDFVKHTPMYAIINNSLSVKFDHHGNDDFIIKKMRVLK